MRKRLDALLFEGGFFPSREKARSAIMAGLIRQGTTVLDKPGIKMAELPEITIVETCPYVSRGGYKIAKALDYFHYDPQGVVALDIGSSTGGFTDCLLQRGAEKVYAVDSGRGQLDWKLRNDPRVVCLERTNARYLEPETLYPEGAPRATLAVMDVSFISILKILPALVRVMDSEGTLLSLIKPQFEAGRSEVQKGVVKSPAAHRKVLETIWQEAETMGVYLQDLTDSPIKGNKAGNREFLGRFTFKGIAANLQKTIDELI